jgi:hypothetical protein
MDSIYNFKMSDEPSQVFFLEEADEEKWIDFQVIDLKEIRIPSDIFDAITIWYQNDKLGEAVYFTPGIYIKRLFKILEEHDMHFTSKGFGTDEWYLIFK